MFCSVLLSGGEGESSDRLRDELTHLLTVTCPSVSQSSSSRLYINVTFPHSQDIPCFACRFMPLSLSRLENQNSDPLVDFVSTSARRTRKRGFPIFDLWSIMIIVIIILAKGEREGGGRRVETRYRTPHNQRGPLPPCIPCIVFSVWCSKIVFHGTCMGPGVFFLAWDRDPVDPNPAVGARICTSPLASLAQI